MPDAEKDAPWWVVASVEATRQTLDELAEDWPEDGMTRAEAQEFIRNTPVVPPPAPERSAAKGWTRKPWPEDRYPTVDEWIDWFLAAPRDQQRAEVAMSLADSERAILCLMLHPQPTRPIPPGGSDA